MKIFLATDHAGFELKEVVRNHLVSSGYDVQDFGAVSYDKTDDYPKYIAPAARAVAGDQSSRAIIFGWSGQGEAMVANRFSGVRAAVCAGPDEEVVRLSREHNDANVLSIGSHFVTHDDALRLIDLWLSLPFSGEERHARRIKEIDELTKI